MPGAVKGARDGIAIAAADFSANVTSRIAFAIATPTAMIAPMND